MIALRVSEVFIQIVALLEVTLPSKTRRTKGCNSSGKVCKKLKRSEDCAGQGIKVVWVRPGRSTNEKSHVSA